MLHFDPQTGLYPDEIETVREAVREDWVLAFRKDGLPDLNTEPETPAGQLIDSQTAAIADKDSEVLYLAQQFNPLTAEGIWQDALGEIYFLKRKPATSSTAVCVCTGLAGTVIMAGSVIKSTEDNSEWVCAATVTIPQGQSSMQAMFTASQPGPVTASPDTLTRIVTVTPGWDAVTNPAAAVTGSAQETQAAFENRRYNSVAANARGSVNALYGTIANLDGVLDALVLENTTSEPRQEWGVTIPGHSVWMRHCREYAGDVSGYRSALAAHLYLQYRTSRAAGLRRARHHSQNRFHGQRHHGKNQGGHTCRFQR